MRKETQISQFWSQIVPRFALILGLLHTPSLWADGLIFFPGNGGEASAAGIFLHLIESGISEIFDSEESSEISKATGLMRVPREPMDYAQAKVYLEKLDFWNTLYSQAATSGISELIQKRRSGERECLTESTTPRCDDRVQSEYEKGGKAILDRARVYSRFFGHQAGVLAVNRIAGEILKSCQALPELTQCDVKVKRTAKGQFSELKEISYGLSAIVVNYRIGDVAASRVIYLGLIREANEANPEGQASADKAKNLVWATHGILDRFRATAANKNIVGVPREVIESRFGRDFFQVRETSPVCAWSDFQYCLMD